MTHFIRGLLSTISHHFSGCLVLNSSARWKKLKQSFLFLCPIMFNIHPRLSFLLLMNSRFVFVCEDASKPSIAPLYLVVEHRSTFFRLQIGTRIDYISVDLLKPVFLDSPVAPAAPPLRGRPPISPGNPGNQNLRCGMFLFQEKEICKVSNSA